MSYFRGNFKLRRIPDWVSFFIEWCFWYAISKAGKLSEKVIGKIAAELVDVSDKKGLSITSEQSIKYFQQNIKNLEKSYKKSIKAK